MSSPCRLDVLVLGPVTVRAGDETIAVERLLERALLARLALAEGSPVPDLRLAADLWGEAELARPTERLRVLASRLRAALVAGSTLAERDGGRGSALPPLVRTPGGYALAAHAADLAKARSAAERAHAAARSGDHEGARGAAAQALGLWRGSALADLRAIPYAEVEGERLEAWRLDLLVRRLTADLALGAAAEVSMELERLAAEHPLHERLCGLLALALYRTGRQADALDRLARLRRRLADTLGVDPVPETSALELRMLRQDPSLQEGGRPQEKVALEITGGREPTAGEPSRGPADPAGESPAEFPAEPSVRAPGPVQPSVRLPGPTTSFVGRDSDLAALVGRLARPGLVTLTGSPGSGKSRLAVEAARAVALGAAPPDGAGLPAATDRSSAAPRAVTLVELASLRREGAVRAAVAAAVGLESESDDPVPELAGRLDGGLLVLDNAEHLIDQAAELVIGLLSRTRALTVLVTSQRPLLAAGEELHRVGPLAEQEAATLFAQRCAPDQVGAEPAAIAAICAAVDRLPLGIELAAGLTRTLTVAQLTARVEDRLRLLVGGGRDAGGRHTSLRAALDWSHDLLAERERAVLRRVSLFSGGFDLEAAEHVVPSVVAAAADHPAPGAAGGAPSDTTAANRAVPDVTAGDVAPALAELADRSLVTVDTSGGGRRFGLLETVKDYARAELDAAGETKSALAAHLGWCLAFVRRIGEPTDFAAAEEVTAVFAEWPNLLDALERAPGTERAADGLRLALELHTPWLIRGWYGEARRHFSALADAPGSTPTEQATALNDHAFVSTMVGRFDEAAELLTRAAELAEISSDDLVTLNVLYYRSIVEIERGRLRDAFPPLLQGLEHAEGIAHTQRMSAFADALGTLHLYSGDARQALERYVTANAFDLESGDEHGLARGLSNQAQALLGMGRPDEAVACAARSDHYAERLDDRQILPLNELIRGAAAAAEGDLTRAERHIRAAVGYAATDGSGAGMAHIDLADLLILRGELDEAAALLDEVYAEAAEHSIPWLAARAVSAALALAAGDRQRAGKLAEATASAYADSGFGWPRYAARLAAVRAALAGP
ncbi:AfsR/SARP family transcriptional regulator [Nonomuraea jiangxiensis]|uniref:Predicted ATPase n=1 Tax=Nonomuraea jiangxiensis TaxID=633440 RepID=A0A1G9SP38_9ACTN|nr:BTAD domain-containing putative transcriptional regulator [Nonomuraea jiangxiensis]SDM36585.1 Predicted ATPase [Nonomuraea jiangxiensis]